MEVVRKHVEGHPKLRLTSFYRVFFFCFNRIKMAYFTICRIPKINDYGLLAVRRSGMKIGFKSESKYRLI